MPRSAACCLILAWGLFGLCVTAALAQSPQIVAANGKQVGVLMELTPWRAEVLVPDGDRITQLTLLTKGFAKTPTQGLFSNADCTGEFFLPKQPRTYFYSGTRINRAKVMEGRAWLIDYETEPFMLHSGSSLTDGGCRPTRGGVAEVMAVREVSIDLADYPPPFRLSLHTTDAVELKLIDSSGRRVGHLLPLSVGEFATVGFPYAGKVLTKAFMLPAIARPWRQEFWFDSADCTGQAYISNSTVVPQMTLPIYELAGTAYAPDATTVLFDARPSGHQSKGRCEAIDTHVNTVLTPIHAIGLKLPSDSPPYRLTIGPHDSVSPRLVDTSGQHIGSGIIDRGSSRVDALFETTDRLVAIAFAANGRQIDPTLNFARADCSGQAYLDDSAYRPTSTPFYLTGVAMKDSVFVPLDGERPRRYEVLSEWQNGQCQALSKQVYGRRARPLPLELPELTLPLRLQLVESQDLGPVVAGQEPPRVLTVLPGRTTGPKQLHGLAAHRSGLLSIDVVSLTEPPHEWLAERFFTAELFPDLVYTLHQQQLIETEFGWEFQGRVTGQSGSHVVTVTSDDGRRVEVGGRTTGQTDSHVVMVIAADGRMYGEIETSEGYFRIDPVSDSASHRVIQFEQRPQPPPLELKPKIEPVAAAEDQPVGRPTIVWGRERVVPAGSPNVDIDSPQQRLNRSGRAPYGSDSQSRIGRMPPSTEYQEPQMPEFCLMRKRPPGGFGNAKVEPWVLPYLQKDEDKQTVFLPVDEDDGRILVDVTTTDLPVYYTDADCRYEPSIRRSDALAATDSYSLDINGEILRPIPEAVEFRGLASRSTWRGCEVLETALVEDVYLAKAVENPGLKVTPCPSEELDRMRARAQQAHQKRVAALTEPVPGVAVVQVEAAKPAVPQPVETHTWSVPTTWRNTRAKAAEHCPYAGRYTNNPPRNVPWFETVAVISWPGPSTSMGGMGYPRSRPIGPLWDRITNAQSLAAAASVADPAWFSKTNNARASELRELINRLAVTTGQGGYKITYRDPRPECGEAVMWVILEELAARLDYERVRNAQNLILRVLGRVPVELEKANAGAQRLLKLQQEDDAASGPSYGAIDAILAQNGVDWISGASRTTANSMDRWMPYSRDKGGFDRVISGPANQLTRLEKSFHTMDPRGFEIIDSPKTQKTAKAFQRYLRPWYGPTSAPPTGHISEVTLRVVLPLAPAVAVEAVLLNRVREFLYLNDTIASAARISEPYWTLITEQDRTRTLEQVKASIDVSLVSVESADPIAGQLRIGFRDGDASRSRAALDVLIDGLRRNLEAETNLLQSSAKELLPLFKTEIKQLESWLSPTKNRLDPLEKEILGAMYDRGAQAVFMMGGESNRAMREGNIDAVSAASRRDVIIRCIPRDGLCGYWQKLQRNHKSEEQRLANMKKLISFLEMKSGPKLKSPFVKIIAESTRSIGAGQ